MASSQHPATAANQASLSTKTAARARDQKPQSLSPNTQASDKSPAFTGDELRRLSLSPALSGRNSPIPDGNYNPGLAGMPTPRAQSTLQRFWANNKPAILVASSQFFGALMNLSARLLELEGEGMHPVQALFIRQFITAVCCSGYMWWVNTPDFPFGCKAIRVLLLIRGFSGFFGIFGMWYSMMYLPLADATVITFLAPGVAGLICYFVLREPFTRMEQVATLVALLGVVLIAQPAAFFKSHDGSAEMENSDGQSSLPGLDHKTTPRERLTAVAVALLGVLGAAGAFTTLRAIGKRAHPLISVNIFALTSTVICVAVLSLAPLLDIGQPVLRWTAPASPKQWFLLLILGALGFIMQYLLTAGLSGDKSNRANAMVYTHMLFAASFDRWVFGHSMGLMSFLGCALILGSAITVVLMKRPPPPAKTEDVERQRNYTGEAEASPMLTTVGGNTDDLHMQRLRP
jgi:drug/metabolite transporter (DMT)-like permease